MKVTPNSKSQHVLMRQISLTWQPWRMQIIIPPKSGWSSHPFFFSAGRTSYKVVTRSCSEMWTKKGKSVTWWHKQAIGSLFWPSATKYHPVGKVYISCDRSSDLGACLEWRQPQSWDTRSFGLVANLGKSNTTVRLKCGVAKAEAIEKSHYSLLPRFPKTQRWDESFKYLFSWRNKNMRKCTIMSTIWQQGTWKD